MQSIRFFLSLLFVFFGQLLLLANETNPSLTEQRNLDGKWLFESALLRQQNRLDQVWTSVVSISSDSFTISNFLDPSKELKGKMRFDEKDENYLDIELEELDFSSLGEPVKIEASTLKGILKFESEDSITIAMNMISSHKRPQRDTAFIREIVASMPWPGLTDGASCSEKTPSPESTSITESVGSKKSCNSLQSAMASIC